MGKKFRLYIGMRIGDTWYNHTECEEIGGGFLAILDGVDKNPVSRMKVLIENSVKNIYTDVDDKGETSSYELNPSDYANFYMDDCWKIGMEMQKQFLDTEEPVFEEYFYCPVCSRKGAEQYTKVEESWQKIIDDGMMDEIFLEEGECSYTTHLPHGIKIDLKSIANGTFKDFTRKPLTIGELQKIVKTPGLTDNEANLLCAMWDAQIKEIKGLSSRDLNILKRNPKDSFTKKYLIAKEDVEEMTLSTMNVGIMPESRSVACKNCNEEIGGGLDFTNFFGFMMPRQQHQNSILK